MNPTLEAPMDIALACANEIADQFTPGFFDERMVEHVGGIIRKHFAAATPAGDGAKSYVATVSDHCDRIVWRGNYYHLPITPATPDLCEALKELLRVDDEWHGAVNSEMARARATGAAPSACAHNWHDYGQHAGRNLTYCSHCQMISAIGSEGTPYGTPTTRSNQS